MPGVNLCAQSTRSNDVLHSLAADPHRTINLVFLHRLRERGKNLEAYGPEIGLRLEVDILEHELKDLCRFSEVNGLVGLGYGRARRVRKHLGVHGEVDAMNLEKDVIRRLDGNVGVCGIDCKVSA